MGLFDKIKDALDGHKNEPEISEVPTPEAQDPTFEPMPETTEVPADDAAHGSIFDDLQKQIDDATTAVQETVNAGEQQIDQVQTAPEVAPLPEAAPEVVPVPEAAPAAPAPAPEAAPTPAAAPAPETYTVVEGDSLWAIAEYYGVSVNAIVEANGIENPDLIFPGQTFVIPR